MNFEPKAEEARVKINIRLRIRCRDYMMDACDLFVWQFVVILASAYLSALPQVYH